MSQDDVRRERDQFRRVFANLGRHWPWPSACRSARCGRWSSPIAPAPAGTPRGGPEIPDRPRLRGRSTPMRRTRSGCCARAASGHRRAAPPRTPRNSRRLMPAPQAQEMASCASNECLDRHPALPWPISRTGVRSRSDRVSTRSLGRPPRGYAATCQTACATVSAASSGVSCFCNTAREREGYANAAPAAPQNFDHQCKTHRAPQTSALIGAETGFARCLARAS